MIGFALKLDIYIRVIAWGWISAFRSLENKWIRFQLLKWISFALLVTF